MLRSSVQTIERYRTATDHFLRYIARNPVKHASLFSARHVEAFIRHLRTIDVAPNGHPHSAKRPLLDKGVKYILECCRALFVYAGKHRHLSPYAPNPFGTVGPIQVKLRLGDGTFVRLVLGFRQLER